VWRGPLSGAECPLWGKADIATALIKAVVAQEIGKIGYAE